MSVCLMCCSCGRFMQADGFVGGAQYKLLPNRIEVLGESPVGPAHAKDFPNEKDAATFAKSRGWRIQTIGGKEDHKCPDCIRVDDAVSAVKVSMVEADSRRSPGACVPSEFVRSLGL